MARKTLPTGQGILVAVNQNSLMTRQRVSVILHDVHLTEMTL